MKDFIVAIDGPAGSGKSTISKIVAKKKGFTYLDTGAMYRMVTLATIKKNVNIENKEEIVDLLKNIKLNIEKDKFYLGNEDVSEEIRGVEVTSNVSKVAAIKEVREELVRLQREISQGKNVILDGRDIGTVVFPNAQLKVFLVGSSEERAKRRVKEFESKGINISYQEVLDEIIKRDKMNSTKEESPLLQAEDAVLVDTSSMSIDEVSNKIVELVDNLF